MVLCAGVADILLFISGAGDLLILDDYLCF